MEPLFNLDSLSPMARGRVGKALDKQFRFSDGVATLRAKLEKENAAHGLTFEETDGMIDYNRRKFNGMNSREQAAYMARLRAKRYYWAVTPDGDSYQIPKVVFDVVQRQPEGE
ncbi:hypothetical protein [Hoeflea sp.]|uniref:hypothetical protein n=1 Tax=Hoeflea sp. TaxID=1940281 RepID=UPI003B51D68F